MPSSTPTANQIFSLSRSIKVVYRPLAELKLDPNNPRLHSKKQIRQIARSITVFGFTTPVLIDNGGRVIAGHGRVQACQILNISEVPTICLEHLTEHQIRAYMIADNRLTENAMWDERMLAEQLKELSKVDLDFSLEVMGFEVSEIDLLIEGLVPVTEGNADPADALPETSIESPMSQVGDLWLLDRHRLFCGNALEQAAYEVLMGDKRAAVVFTDPPYNVRIAGHVSGLGAVKHQDFQMASGEMNESKFIAFLTQALNLLSRSSYDGALHYICIDWRHLRELLAAGRTAYDELVNLCVWVKGNGGMGSFYRSEHELVLVFKHGTASHRNNVQLGKYGRYRTNVWRYPGMNSFARESYEGNMLTWHPTPKPVELVADALLDSSARGDIVLDAFLGSGTTVMAAERTGRICYGMEIDPSYVDTTIRRWQSFTGQIAVHGESGQSFNELRVKRGDTHG